MASLKEDAREPEKKEQPEVSQDYVKLSGRLTDGRTDGLTD